MQKPDKKDRFSREVAKLLPAKISSIKVQKKNSFRFSLFIEEKFLVGVSDSTLVQFSLSKGVVLTPLLFQDICKKEDEWAIREYFIRLLGRRDHARNELRDKARRKDFPPNSVEQVLNELTEKKYINNLKFAKKFVNDKFKFNKWGSNKIRVELFKKGISEKEITVALKEINESSKLKTIEELIRKNGNKFKRAEPLKRKKKIFDFLLRKGYDSNNILKQMPKLLSIIEQ